jgi:NAD(P)-dependent dehydrogenase (short-subunit alcohol dehydrogenase family)
MDIAGKVFIVTGGASGLGEGTARMLATHGAKVIVADLQVERGQAIAAEIGGLSVRKPTARPRLRLPWPRAS